MCTLLGHHHPPMLPNTFGPPTPPLHQRSVTSTWVLTTLWGAPLPTLPIHPAVAWGNYHTFGAHATCTACLPHFNLSCQSIWQNCSSAGEPVKNPFSVAYWVTPKTFLGLFSASAVSPLAGTLDYCSMTHGWITFSFWVISWCNPQRPMRAQP